MGSKPRTQTCQLPLPRVRLTPLSVDFFEQSKVTLNAYICQVVYFLPVRLSVGLSKSCMLSFVPIKPVKDIEDMLIQLGVRVKK